MKRIFVREEWCLGCHLCEYNCAFANSGLRDMAYALSGHKIYPRITVDGGENSKINFAVSCRHCENPICVKSCISGALHVENGVVCIDKNKCVGCLTCILVCPYGALSVSESGVAQKCELCTHNSCTEPACVKGCPNRAIVYNDDGKPER